MRTNETHRKAAYSGEEPSGSIVKGAATAPPNPLSRRSFFGRVGTSAALAAATSAALPSLLLSKSARADDDDGDADDSASRRERSYRIRKRAALAERDIPTPPHISNGDEKLYSNFIGNYTQGLPHDSLGEVVPAAYQAFLTACDTGKPSDFALIPLGGTSKLVDPQGGLAYDLEGTDSGQLTVLPAPKLASAHRAGEAVEDYWMALARDVPFSQYGAEPITAAAIVELNTLSHFEGPKVNGKIAPGTLFRGISPGDLIGPYVSQFFLSPVTFGVLSVTQQFNAYMPDKDYQTTFAEWLAVQNGQGPFPANTLTGGTTYTQERSRSGCFWPRGYRIPGLPLRSAVAPHPRSSF